MCLILADVSADRGTTAPVISESGRVLIARHQRCYRAHENCEGKWTDNAGEKKVWSTGYENSQAELGLGSAGWLGPLAWT